MADMENPDDFQIIYNDSFNVDTPDGGNLLGNIFAEIARRYPRVLASCACATAALSQPIKKDNQPEIKKKILS